MNPLITIVIPTNNRLHLLRQAVASIQEQNYNNWELFIVDDGSTDGTQEWIKSIADDRIHLIESVNKGNVAALRNEGVRAGKGEWLAFLDSDDYWVPRKLELQWAVLAIEQTEWAYTRYELVDSEGNYLPHRSNRFNPIAGFVAEAMLQSLTDITICSVIVRRSLFNSIDGFDESPSLCHRTDFDFLLRLAIASAVAVVPDTLLHVRDHQQRSTRLLGNGHQQTAFAFSNFLQQSPAPRLAQLAKKRLAFHQAESTLEKIQARQYADAFHRFWQALKNGDKLTHLLSVMRRSIKPILLK